MSVFSQVAQAPVIEVFALSEAYNKDTAANKVNLTVGAYRTEEGKPWVLPVVHTVENQLASDAHLNKEYLPVLGLPDFIKASLRVLLGEGHPALANNLVCGVQSLGGTGALFLGMAFLKQVLKKTTIYVSNPTWPNHKGIASLLGYEHIKEYRYWDAANKCVDINGMLQDFKDAENGSVILLHACAHNPTGMDISHEQWATIANLIREKNHFPMFDIAYQGFASGDLNADAYAVRYFADLKFEMFAAQSFSKNFGLYNERVGNLAIFSSDKTCVEKILSQVTLIVRKTYSNPPNHGGRVVSTVLNNPSLFAEWQENVRTMADRVKLMRKLLFEKLRALGTKGTWNHIVDQIGMFSFTGLTKQQAEYLRTNYHIYLMNDGRINMCGLNKHNVDYVAEAIHDAVTKFS